MADVYATIAEADEAVQENLAEVLELRAADPQQRAMLDAYLDDLPLPADARVVEIGCGTGAVARTLAGLPGVKQVVGLDPSLVFIEHAARQAQDVSNLSFVTGDGRVLPFDDSSVDAVVCHTSLCHIPEPQRVLAEARRVTMEGGAIAIFDGDYATTTVAISADDPLQACADAAVAALVHDRYLVRRLPRLIEEAGWQLLGVRSHGYVEAEQPGYMLTIIDRGADSLVAAGTIGEPAAEALKTEARRRAENREFFGHIAYVSVIGIQARRRS
jgi:ubiquinone/menaquinone biosynthesis C-methylase UbiE